MGALRLSYSGRAWRIVVRALCSLSFVVCSLFFFFSLFLLLFVLLSSSLPPLSSLCSLLPYLLCALVRTLGAGDLGAQQSQPGIPPGGCTYRGAQTLFKRVCAESSSSLLLDIHSCLKSCAEPASSTIFRAAHKRSEDATTVCLGEALVCCKRCPQY